MIETKENLNQSKDQTKENIKATGSIQRNCLNLTL